MKKTLGWSIAFFVLFTILMLGGTTAMDIVVWFILVVAGLCAIMFALGALMWIGKAVRAAGHVIDRNDPQSPITKSPSVAVHDVPSVRASSVGPSISFKT